MSQPPKEGNTSAETIERLRIHVLTLRDNIARVNIINHIDKLVFPLSGNIEDVLQDVPEVVVASPSLSDEEQVVLTVYSHGMFCDEGSELDNMDDVLATYAAITRADYRALRDEHKKNLFEIRKERRLIRGNKEVEEDDRFEQIEKGFIRANEPDLLKGLIGALAETLKRISPPNPYTLYRELTS